MQVSLVGFPPVETGKKPLQFYGKNHLLTDVKY